MEKRFYKVISGDGHLESPGDWQKYLPAKYKDRAPRLVEVPGGQGWVMENQPLLVNGRTLNGGRRPMDIFTCNYFNEDGTYVAGAGPADQRLREQDLDGIDAEVLFPAVQCSRLIEGLAKERDAYLAMVQAYNDWIAQDYCAVAPDRLIAMAVVPITGVDDAIAEMKRCKGLGIKGICLQTFPNGSLRVKPEDDKYWAASLDLEMPIANHGLRMGIAPVSGGMNVVSTAGNFASYLSGGERFQGKGFPAPVIQLITEGVFDRFPKLQFFTAETGAAWMPGALANLEDNFDRYWSTFPDVKLKLRPMDYLRRNTRYSFVNEPLAMGLRAYNPLWEDLMWGSDCPHGVTSYPYSQEALGEIFEDTPDTKREKILVHNPAEYFHLDVENPITPTPTTRSSPASAIPEREPSAAGRK